MICFKVFRSTVCSAICLMGTLLLGSVSAYAEVLFEQSMGVSNSFYCSSCNDGWRVWDRFSLTGDATITQINAVIAYGGGQTDRQPDGTVQWIGGEPIIDFSVWDVTRTNQLFSQSFLFDSQLSPRVINGSVNEVSAIGISISLPAASYYLSIFDSEGRYGISWAGTGGRVDGFSFQSRNADGTGELGSGTNQNMVFSVLGDMAPVAAIPEPETYAMLLAGLSLLGFVARRRKLKIASA